MDNPGNHNNKESEGSFYKGLFFGLLLGIGVVWFLGSESGKEFVKKTRKRIDDALAAEPGLADYEEEDISAAPEPESKSTTSVPRRFFHKKEE
jgi:hypothetical protein